MLSQLSVIARRLRHNTLAIPAALLVAALMIGINEMSYRGAQSRLERLAEIGLARVLLLQTLHRTTEAESGKRGYMMTGGREYLVPYQEARADVVANLQKLEQAYTRFGDAEGKRRLARLNAATNTKLAEMEEVKRLFDDGKASQALDIVRSGIGREMMLQVRSEGSELVAQQSKRIGEGLDDIFDTLLLNRIGITMMTLVALVALAMFVRLSRQLDEQQRQRQAEVAAERDRLELEVGRRTAELTELARHLQTAREDERAHLARELHDELGALLTAAKLDVARIKPKLQQSAPDLVPRLTHLTESLNSGIALKRRIIEDLRPSTLSSLGLGPALEIQCSEFKDRSGLKIELELEPVKLSPTAELTIFRLVQEALTNVAKYAEATEVRVSLRNAEGHGEINVTDNGIGFDERSVRRGSHGLMGMRFRVEAERGQFQLITAVGQGTRILARLPMVDDTGDAT